MDKLLQKCTELKLSEIEVSEIWIGEMCLFDRGAIYLQTAYKTYKLDFYFPPHYHRVLYRVSADDVTFDQVFEIATDSCLIEDIRNNANQAADHLKWYHVRLNTKQLVIDVIS